MGRRKLVTINAIIAIAAFIMGLFVSSWYNSNQTNVSQVHITDFTADMSWNNPVGVTMAIVFNVTVQNLGSQNISNAQLIVQRLNEQNSSASNYYYPLVNLGVIHSGEIRQVRVDFFFGLDRYSEYVSSNYLAILSINGSTILDARKLY